MLKRVKITCKNNFISQQKFFDDHVAFIGAAI